MRSVAVAEQILQGANRNRVSRYPHFRGADVPVGRPAGVNLCGLGIELGPSTHQTAQWLEDTPAFGTLFLAETSDMHRKLRDELIRCRPDEMPKRGTSCGVLWYADCLFSGDQGDQPHSGPERDGATRPCFAKNNDLSKQVIDWLLPTWN